MTHRYRTPVRPALSQHEARAVIELIQAAQLLGLTPRSGRKAYAARAAGKLARAFTRAAARDFAAGRVSLPPGPLSS